MIGFKKNSLFINIPLTFYFKVCICTFYNICIFYKLFFRLFIAKFALHKNKDNICKKKILKKFWKSTWKFYEIFCKKKIFFLKFLNVIYFVMFYNHSNRMWSFIGSNRLSRKFNLLYLINSDHTLKFIGQTRDFEIEERSERIYAEKVTVFCQSSI